MPWIKGKFYMNASYGRALERARRADQGLPWSEDELEVEPAIFRTNQQQGFVPQHAAIDATPDEDGNATLEVAAANSRAQDHRTSPHNQAHTHPTHGSGHNAATTTAGVASQIYNETSGLRVTNRKDNGPGSYVDMQEARNAMAHVIQNRARSHKTGGLASSQLTPQEQNATRVFASPAADAHGESLFEAHRANSQADTTGGAKYFYLDHGQSPPSFAIGKAPAATFGPFLNTNDKGDVPKGASVWIKVYR